MRTVVVVGSGLAGLSCAVELAATGAAVTVVTAGRAGLDGATARVHRLAPWILLTAPVVRGDSPQRYLADLQRRGGGLTRPGLTELLAEGSQATAAEIESLLCLRRLDDGPVLLPGDELPRAQRFLPEQHRCLLAPLLAQCRERRVAIREHTTLVGLALNGDAVAGAAVLAPGATTPEVIPCRALVLACGGASGAFPMTTAPALCCGAGLAVARTAGVPLHHPELLQWLPLATRPRGAFPGSRLLLDAPATIAGHETGSLATLADLCAAMSEAPGSPEAELELPPGPPRSWPERTPLARSLPWGERARYQIGVHHSMGGIAVDAWGRTSVTGLFACGEAAGGIQGRQRTMGTGLIEARLLGCRVAHAILQDPVRAPERGQAVTALVAPAERPAALARELATVLRRPNDLSSKWDVWQRIEAWPRSTGPAELPAWRAGLRLDAVLAIAEAASGRRPRRER